MPITYARFVHRKPEPDPFRATFEELEEETVLLFDAVAEATTTDIGELYRRLDPGLRTSEVIVFRGAGPSLIDAIEKDPLLPDFLTGNQVMALIGETRAGDAAPALLPVPKFPTPDKPPLIENLREVELTSILRRSQAVFSSNEYHYELPSGLHAEQFVRLADALRSVYDVRRITDWALPHLSGDTIVVADTGSMLPLLIDLREQARSRFGWNIEISTLDRYPRDAIAVSDAISAVRNRPMAVDARFAGTAPGFLVLISVNSSGRLCRLFRTMGPPDGKIVVVCQTSTEKSPCDQVLVTIPVNRWEVAPNGTCDRCKDLHVIRVHHESYELLPSIKREPVKIDKALAEAKSAFWTMVDAADAVQLHIDVPYVEREQPGHRHFGVYLDTAKLAGHAEFRQRCIDQLKKVASPDLVIIPQHHTSTVVAVLCADAHPGCVTCTLPPGRFSQDVQARLAGATGYWSPTTRS